MAVINTPQRIELQYGGQTHWFQVWRFETMPDLHAALLKDDIREFEKNTTAHTASYPAIVGGKPNEECGRMYLLDKSIGTLATEATKMAFAILGRAGQRKLSSKALAELTGAITSALYSKSKYF